MRVPLTPRRRRRRCRFSPERQTQWQTSILLCCYIIQWPLGGRCPTRSVRAYTHAHTRISCITVIVIIIYYHVRGIGILVP